MAHRDVVVIGASSGGLKTLTTMVGALPSNFPAAILVVLHVRPDRPSQLPAILNRAGRMPAAHAVDGEPVRRGRIYIAPPDMHTYLQRGRICVRRGPRENNVRPAADPLFRTAAHYYGRRVIGVILSGSMDDGAAGLAAVKTAGGVAVVQDPDDAAFPDMPLNALEQADCDFRVKADELGPVLVELVRSTEPSHVADGDTIPDEIPLETVEEAADPDDACRSEQLGPPAALSCPDCQGTLYEITDGSHLRFRCRVGHAYSEDAILKAHTESAERALWSALRVLEERSALMTKLAGYARRRGHDRVAELFEQRISEVETDVKAIHELVTRTGSLEPVEQSAN